MNDSKRWSFFGIVSLGLGIGSVIVVGRSVARTVNRWRIIRRGNKLQQVLHEKLNNPLPHTMLVSHPSDWEQIHSFLSKDYKEIPILGFDCEWVNFNGINKPVALIQLASHRGICALVRVCNFTSLPETLKDVLSNPDIIKVGVATWEDATKLKKDLNIPVRGMYDVRHLIQKHPHSETLSSKSGLAGLSEQLLGTVLNKHYKVRCSDWEAEKLCEEQIRYAAQDAIASIAVCLKMVLETSSREVAASWPLEDVKDFYSKWTASLSQIDIKYKAKAIRKPPVNSSNGKGRNHTVPSKPAGSRAYAARKSDLYDNCILQAPDGQQLCTCDQKKAMWYVSKERGEVVCENPLTVRLNFEPAGRPSSDYDKYYLMEKDNMCVVCGKRERFVRKNIVPHEYRKHFPTFLKDHKSHDILLLCLDCHALCNAHENGLKEALAVECNAPIGTQANVKLKLDKRLGGVHSASNALTVSRHMMPPERVKELEDKIKDYYNVDEITPEVLERGRNLEIHVANEDYFSHGLKVVQHFEERQRQGDGDGLMELERRWREYFLLKMEPRHMPALWSVEHHRTKEQQWGSNRTASDDA